MKRKYKEISAKEKGHSFFAPLFLQEETNFFATLLDGATRPEPNIEQACILAQTSLKIMAILNCWKGYKGLEAVEILDSDQDHVQKTKHLLNYMVDHTLPMMERHDQVDNFHVRSSLWEEITSQHNNAGIVAWIGLEEAGKILAKNDFRASGRKLIDLGQSEKSRNNVQAFQHNREITDFDYAYRGFKNQLPTEAPEFNSPVPPALQ